MTPEQEAKYIRERGCRCPFCGSADISGDSVEVNEGFAMQEIGCPQCGKQWTDVYTLTHVNMTNV